MIGGVRVAFWPLAASRFAGYNLGANSLGAISLSDFVATFSSLPLLSALPLILAQAAKEGGGAPGEGAGGWGEGIFGSMMFPLMITLVLMYFLLMRPEQRKRKDMERQLSTLKKNDHVVTIGGIAGTIVVANEGSKFVTLRIDDSTGTKVRVLRTAISHIGPAEEAEAEAEAKGK
jgi:preprotein translocase subunit YajC